MAEEESFVILGSSPPSSLLSCVVEQSESDHDAVANSIARASEPPQTLVDISVVDAKNLCASEIAHETIKSENSKKTQQASAPIPRLSSEDQCGSVRTETVITENTCNNAAAGTDSTDSSLAAGFILGSIDANVLKTSIYSQFPSLSMHACAEDVVKFQTILDEYLKMKDMLLKVNTNIRLLYEKTYRWNQTMQTMETQYKEKTEAFELQIAQLRNENLLLKREVDTKMEQMHICEKVRANEQEELVRSVSEKTAQINNMAQQIQTLEQQQLASYEYVAIEKPPECVDELEYVSQLEHNRIVKDLERKMSVLLAEKLDLTDVQAQYIDEINCLKVNLTTAEELINQLRADITLLKSKDDERVEQFSQYAEERDRMKEEFSLLRQQVEVYSKDFEQERIARQNLAGEKDQLLQDLRVLQRKNQELIAAKENPSSTSSGQNQPIASSFASSASSVRVLPQHSNAPYRCPICSKGYDSLAGIQSHANMCIDAIN